MAVRGPLASRAAVPVGAPALERKLGLLEALGLSLSIVGPSMTMAFNVSLVVRAAGKAAPLAFAIGTLALGMVALSFVKFSRRMAHAGSAYAFIGKAFGWRWGVVAGCTLLLTYLTYAAAAAALIGNFLDAALRNYSTQTGKVWFVSGAVGLLLAGVCAYRDVKLAGRLMLVLEGLSVLAIIFLSLAILARVALTTGLSLEPFRPAADKHWSGIGYGLVFCVLSFAGFEGATTLGEETQNPHRNIPIAILGTCIVAGAFYVFVSYAQVVGFGIDSATNLADAIAPLNDLAIRYVSRNFATAVDLAAAISAFSCVLGSLSAAARLLFALNRAGLGGKIGNVHSAPGSPATAVIFAVLLCIASFVVHAPIMGPANYCAYLLMIGTLALIVVYIGMTVADLSYSFRIRGLSCVTCGVAGTVVLLWSLYNTIYPPPAFPEKLCPYLVLIWVLCGAAMSAIIPQLQRRDMPWADDKLAASEQPRVFRPDLHSSKYKLSEGLLVMTSIEIEESNLHLREVWKLYAQMSPGGKVFDQDGLSVANARQPWFFMNIGMLNKPVIDEPDLERRAKEAVEHFNAEKNPWVLAASEDWFGSNADAVLSESGLEHRLDLTGMVADRLKAPVHWLPDVQIRRIADEETRFAIADLNAEGYGVPSEWARKAISSKSLWQMPLYGTVAYVKGEPASGAFTLLVDKALYGLICGVGCDSACLPAAGSCGARNPKEPGRCQKRDGRRTHGSSRHRAGVFGVPKDGISVGCKISFLRPAELIAWISGVLDAAFEGFYDPLHWLL